ncbi:MAG: hypothetical protein Q8O89_01320 [Nanoarchaeota archaeon]|nr:hypothetical protein [Nanoarchaeota archaeon]
MAVEDKIKERFDLVTRSQRAADLDFMCYRITTKPILAEGYSSCNAVVLFGIGSDFKRHVGVSHYSNDDSGVEPKEYLPVFVKSMNAIVRRDTMRAILVGGMLLTLIKIK